MKRTITAVAVVVLAIAGCSGDEPDSSNDDRQTGNAEQSGTSEVPDPLGNCDELAGLATAEVVEVGLCTGGDTQQILASANYECSDGTKLHWNDFGWGYSDGDWHAHERDDGQLVPPQNEIDACRA